ncbi:MAG: hypothetical protein IJ357_02690 [Oscillospiraceae bacterium]|nr:hypothetical protein [Oscillospiraceae bacterium]
MKKKMLILTALVLLCALLLQGCMPWVMWEVYEDLQAELEVPSYSIEASDAPLATDDIEASEVPEETVRPTLPDEPVERPYEARLAPVSFHEMTYVRPDAAALIAQVNEVTAMVETDAGCNTILNAFEPVYDDYVSFSTMSSLAYIHYTLDLEDSYYDTEYNWCEEQSPLIEQALEKCYIAMANSRVRDDLEAVFFGEGFFEYYDEHQIYSDDRVVALMQQESELQSEYMALQSNMTISWNGQEVLMDELMADATLSYEDYLSALELYYGKYNPLSAEIFIDLIQVRKEIAEVLGYESYADFAYEFYYERDYSPAQAAAYITDIAEDLVPVYAGTFIYTSLDEADEEQVMTLLEDAAAQIGGAVDEAYDYMLTYDLYDMTASPNKMPGSYMTYLPSYEMPFVYISPTGSLDDFLTAAHEFGHFVDAYVNCNMTTSVDCAEIFSQGLEFLALDVADLNASQRRELEESKLYDSLSIFISQACYSEFERRAYELPEDQLSAEALNDLFLECSEQFASSYAGMEQYIAPGWVDVQHFFIAPFYMISYCVSNDVALQIYQRQLEQGDGLLLYSELMQNAAENTILNLLDTVGAESPFTPGRSAELAEFFEDQLN